MKILLSTAFLSASLMATNLVTQAKNSGLQAIPLKK